MDVVDMRTASAAAYVVLKMQVVGSSKPGCGVNFDASHEDVFCAGFAKGVEWLLGQLVEAQRNAAPERGGRRTT